MSLQRTRFLALTRFACVLAWILTASIVCTAEPDSKPPAVGDRAPDFSLKQFDGESIKLSALTKESPVVVIVLRGYPGYQCPICSKQVGRFISSASKLQKAGAQVVMVYPGPSDELQKRAEEFITGKTLPDDFHLVIDPDYEFTDAWKLRWDEPRETAYPSTFVVGKDGKVKYAKVSKTHGGRASVEDVLEALKEE
jgi:peroxiredoxin